MATEPKFETPWWAKLIVGVVVITSTIVGSIWTGFETLDGRMNDKVQTEKAEVIAIVHNESKSILTLIESLRNERNQLLKAQDDKVTVQLVDLKAEVSEVRKDVRSLLGIARRSQVFVEKEDSPYTITKQDEIHNHEESPL